MSSSPNWNDAKDQINYTKEAFFNQYNIISLVGLGIFTLMGGGLAAALIGAGAEILYLAFTPEMKRFQRAVQARKFQEERLAKQARLHEKIKLLNPHDRKKYAELSQLVKRIEHNYSDLDSISKQMLENSKNKLSHLLETYLRLLILKEQQVLYMRNADQDQIQNDLKKLETDIKDASPRVKEIQQRRIAILKKRLERYDKAKEHRQIINAQLLTIEDTLKLIQDQSFTLKDPSQLSEHLDSLLVDMESTEETVREMEDLFSMTDQMTNLSYVNQLQRQRN